MSPARNYWWTAAWHKLEIEAEGKPGSVDPGFRGCGKPGKQSVLPQKGLGCL